MREDGEIRPKPMVEIGEKPILWHILKIYAHYGFTNFILPLGFHGEEIRAYFSTPEYRSQYNITFVETGENTLKGGRIKRIESYLKADHFHLTYGDGVSDIDLVKLHRFHLSHKRLATVTAVRPPSRFGELVLRGDAVRQFIEKPQLSSGTINGGFFVFKKELLDSLTRDENCDLEFGVLQQLAQRGQLHAYQHLGFWQCMDTPRERDYLNSLWDNGAPWKIWKTHEKRNDRAEKR